MTDRLESDGTIDAEPPDPPGPPEVGETTEEHGRSLRRAASLTALVGVAFSIIFTVAFVLTGGIPGVNATDDEIFAYYTEADRVLPVAVGLYIMPFAGIAFLWFIVALRLWAATSARRLNVLQSNLQLVSGVIFVASFFVGAAASSVLAVSVQFANGPVDPVTARQFPIFGESIILFFAMRMAAMFVFTTSSLGRSAHILPAWFAWVGFLVGLFLLFAATTSPLLVLMFPAWVLVLSLILLRNAQRIPQDVRLPVGTGSMLNPIVPTQRPRKGP